MQTCSQFYPKTYDHGRVPALDYYQYREFGSRFYLSVTCVDPQYRPHKLE